MKLLLDESLPRKLSASFPSSYEVQTVAQMGWAGTKNGELLQLAASHEFHALITADQGIEHQQNPESFPICIVVLIAQRTRLNDLKPLIPEVVALLESQPAIGAYRVAV